MDHFFSKLLVFICIYSSFFSLASAEIKPPNYDFNLATLEPFFPSKNVVELQKTYKFDIFQDNGNSKILRTKFKKPDYVLDIYIQTRDDKITDLFVRLPQHFLHDLFLLDLQTRFKKQDRFVRKDGSALYVWLNRDNNHIVYHGSCTITCFPMFIEMTNTDKTVIPIYQTLNLAIPKW